MSAMPYVGSRINLISRSNIRFIGTLNNINQAESSITLENVQSFGTEGRFGNELDVPGSEYIYPLIVFRGKDVLELNVLEDQPPVFQSQYYSEPNYYNHAYLPQQHIPQHQLPQTHAVQPQAGKPFINQTQMMPQQPYSQQPETTLLHQPVQGSSEVFLS